MRIAIFIDHLRRIGGAEALVLSQIHEMAKLGCTFDVYGMHDPDPDLQAIVKSTGGKCFTFKGSSVFDLHRLYRIVSTLRKNPVDILATHLVGSTITGLIAGAIVRRPVLVTIHNTTYGQSTAASRRRTTFSRFLAKHIATEILTVGPKVQQVTEKHFPKRKPILVCNAVASVQAITPEQRRHLLRESNANAFEYIVMTAGRIEPQKAYDELVDAWRTVADELPSAGLLIAGDGSLLNSLEAHVERHKLSDHVRLLGRTTAVREFMQCADAFVLSSHWEGMPVAMLEAMASRLPVISTDVGDVASVLDGQTGILVPAKRPDLLAKEIIRVLKDTALRADISKRSYERWKSDYNLETWARLHHSICKNVLARAA